ncbi:MAG: DUF4249 domain-containing protein [Bacteroidales bacterium]|nr:DUF4249 domain-containing protein [Bacteroidales bacterium]
MNLRKDKYLSILIILICLFTFSCNKEPVNVELNLYKPQMVIECYLTNWNKFNLRISHKYNPDSTLAFKPITNAKVELYEDNHLIGYPSHDSMGIYSLDFTPSSQHTYKLLVSHPEYNTCEASVTTPDTFDFLVDTNYVEKYINERYFQFKVKVPHSNISKYYAISVSHNYYRYFTCSLKTELYRNTEFIMNKPHNIEFVSKWHKSFLDKNIRFEILSSETNSAGYILFTKSHLLGNNWITLETNYHNFDPANTVIVYELSVDVYKNFLSRAIYNKQTSSSITSPFYTPNAIYGNIKNGIGIFGYIFLNEKRISQLPTVVDYCY